MNTIKFV